MLRSLELQRIGPCWDPVKVTFGERLTLLTGDNGAGKSLLLDVSFWALTRQWSAPQAVPVLEDEGPVGAHLAFEIEGKVGSPRRVEARFERSDWRWVTERGRPANPGVVVHARVDGGFAVWDPARNWAAGGGADQAAPYVLDDRALWDGLEVEGRRACEGLVRDWLSWQRSAAPEFDRLKEVLRLLSTPSEPLSPGAPMQISPEDGHDVPTLSMPYGVVPVTHASAGVRRILGLAYLLVWARREHERAARLRGWNPEDTRSFVLLFDEPETHLHPKWQRALIPALIGAADGLGPWRTQLITATHSPLVLASMETSFDDAQDRLLDLELVPRTAFTAFRADERGNEVIESDFNPSLHPQTLQVRDVPYRRRGDASAWLTSESFGLRTARSWEAEQALEAAERVLAAPASMAPEDAKRIDDALRAVLPDQDPFWVRWRYVAEARGWVS